MADNRLGDESAFSKNQLKAALEGLIQLGGDLTFTGFDSFEMDTMFAHSESAVSRYRGLFYAFEALLATSALAHPFTPSSGRHG